MLLPTITSRCHLLKFLPLSKDDLASALESFSDISKQSNIDIIHQLSGGSIRLAKEMITLDLLENLTDIMDLLSRSWPLAALDIDTIFEKWQRSLRRNQSLSLEDKIVMVINWLSEGLVKFNKVSDKYATCLKNEDLILPDTLDGITAEIPPSKFDSDISTNVAMVLSKINMKPPITPRLSYTQTIRASSD